MPQDRNEAADLIPGTLDSRHVDELLSGGHQAARAEIAQAVGAILGAEKLSPNEQELAIDILSVLARDIQEQVRSAVAKSVMSSSLLPRSLACQLANDVESVSLPILKASKVLSEGDLIAVVRSGNLNKQLAVAKREQVSSQVVQALLDVDHSEVTSAVVENRGSEINEEQYHLIIERAPDQAGLQTAVARRIKLPVSVTAKLIDMAAEGIQDTLIESQGIPPFLADQMIDCAREAMLAEQVTEQQSDDSLVRFAAHLHSRDKLTESLLLRALLEGYVSFFEAAFAELAEIPLRNARAIMYYGGSEGLRKLFERTGLSEILYIPLQVGVRFVRTTRDEQKLDDALRWPAELTEKLIQLLVKVDRRFQYGTVEQIVSKFRYDLENAPPARAV